MKLVTETSGDDFYPQWSTDGEWIAYDRLVSGAHSAWKAPATGGAPVPILLAASGIRASTPSFAPDGAVVLAGVGPSFPGAATRTLDAALTGRTLTDVAHRGRKDVDAPHQQHVVGATERGDPGRRPPGGCR